MSIVEEILRPFLLIKAKKINYCCNGFIKGRVLDIGGGRCYIAKELQDKNKVEVTCLDIKNLSQIGIKVIIYDGKNMPFKNNEFDTALIAYVLHHCDEPLQILKEAVRICKGNIIIFEDTKPSFITNIMDFLSNRLRGVETPFKFHTMQEWVEIFNRMNLKIVNIKRGVEKEWFYPFVEHTMFVVKVK